jgi:hypothetical protein
MHKKVFIFPTIHSTMNLDSAHHEGLIHRHQQDKECSRTRSIDRLTEVNRDEHLKLRRGRLPPSPLPFQQQSAKQQDTKEEKRWQGKTKGNEKRSDRESDTPTSKGRHYPIVAHPSIIPSSISSIPAASLQHHTPNNKTSQQLRQHTHYPSIHSSSFIPSIITTKSK